MARFYISDTHFGHANIIKYDKRPFKDVDEMNSEMIKRWNSVVAPGDTVYILGDFCWKKESEWYDIVQQLTGNKVLIRGNHDLKQMPGKLLKYFQDVKDIKTIHDGDYEVVMCHYPLLFYPHAYQKNTIMLCGHVHLTRECFWLETFRDTMRVFQDKYNEAGGSAARIINVGAMMSWMDYTPRTLEDILERTGL